jgi:hypothetical protein
MERLKLKFSAVFLCVVALNHFFSCAHKESTVTGDTEVETWELQLTGDTQGRLKLLIMRTKIENDTYAIAGKLYGKIEDHIGGPGQAAYELEGKIEKDVFKARFSGHSDMAEGPSDVSGHMRGSVFKSRGSGTWNAVHSLGSSAGNYSMKIIR